MPDTCTAVSPALEGGTCTRAPCTGRHSWQGPAPPAAEMAAPKPAKPSRRRKA